MRAAGKGKPIRNAGAAAARKRTAGFAGTGSVSREGIRKYTAVLSATTVGNIHTG